MAAKRVAGRSVTADERELTLFLKSAYDLIDVVEHSRGKLEIVNFYIQALENVCAIWRRLHARRAA